jgi:Tfp pilus assembly protein PilO
MPIVGYKFYGRNIRPYLEEQKKKSYTILGMTLFSLVVFGAFAIRPSLATISRLRQEVKEARAAEEKLDQKISDLSQAQVNYQLALESVELVNQALPPEPPVPAIIEELALTAGRNNIGLEEAVFDPAPFCDGKRCGVPFTVKAVGELPNIQNFITELENGIRQIDVQKVKMNRSGENLKHLVAEIELVAWFYDEGAQ